MNAPEPGVPPLRVLILADEDIARREREMILRLQVGLADEGVRVAYALPVSVGGEESSWPPPGSDLVARHLVYEPHGVPWRRRQRLAALLEAVEVLRGADDSRPLDVVHAMGEGSWNTAMDLAQACGAGLVVSLWSRAAARAAPRLRASPAGSSPPGPLFLVPDEALEREARQSLEGVGGGEVHLRRVSWGVHALQHSREILVPGRVVSIVLGGGGGDAEAYAAALEGLSRVVARGSDLLLFVDVDVAERAALAPHVRRLSLVDRFTLVPDLEARRELVLAADLLVLPEARGEHRSLTLDAMGNGVAVVALADPLVAYLIRDRTACLVEGPRVQPWVEGLCSVVENRDYGRTLGESARRYVAQHHRVSAHVAAVLDAYEWFSGREPYPFHSPKNPGPVR